MTKYAAMLPCVLLAAACASRSPDPAPHPAVTEPAVSEPPVETVTPGAADRTTDLPVDPTASLARAPRFTFTGSILTTLTGDVHSAVVELLVLDEVGQPAANVEIEGQFSNGIKGRAVVTTGPDGIAIATATGGKQHMRVGFTVTGVTYLKDGVRSSGEPIVDLIYPSPCCPLRTPPSN